MLDAVSGGIFIYDLTTPIRRRLSENRSKMLEKMSSVCKLAWMLGTTTLRGPQGFEAAQGAACSE